MLPALHGCGRSNHHGDGDGDGGAAPALLRPQVQHRLSRQLPRLVMCMAIAALLRPSAVRWLPHRLAELHLPLLHQHLHPPARLNALY